MNKINYPLIILISFFLLSCQSIKDGLSGKKSENSDEFLVQKKNPLVLPPNYMELPEPKSEDINDNYTLLEEEINLLTEEYICWAMSSLKLSSQYRNFHG